MPLIDAFDAAISLHFLSPSMPLYFRRLSLMPYADFSFFAAFAFFHSSFLYDCRFHFADAPA